MDASDGDEKRRKWGEPGYTVLFNVNEALSVLLSVNPHPGLLITH